MANSYINFINIGKQVTEKTQALYLAEEGLELVRFVRDDDWSNIGTLSAGVPYALALSSTAIGVTTIPEIEGVFRRTFTISNVYRNPSTDDIVASTTAGSVADINSKYITVNVTWGSPTTTVSLTGILTNLDL